MKQPNESLHNMAYRARRQSASRVYLGQSIFGCLFLGQSIFGCLCLGQTISGCLCLGPNMFGCLCFGQSMFGCLYSILLKRPRCLSLGIRQSEFALKHLGLMVLSVVVRGS